MNRIFLFVILCVIALSSCKQKIRKDENLNGKLVQNPNTLTSDSSGRKMAEMNFETLEHDFGKIKEGDKVEYDFKFTNTGEGPLLISTVHASCGCTTPDWPKGVIQPGASDLIKVVFNSTGKDGQFDKKITITSNTYPNTIVLSISGIVVIE